ncbi:hypothetical protein ASAC_0768 [Acidilobus saccharovorans 345-15]|uniref:Uncharacterized protein n=1 Tax=Acidilobus saccharovorans (strain DSM 16705 / JCM 18335 / VKM B-2471 / 345-15) TaxID=666510 RepID=D9Q1I6_ACIS3|nr:hypothetical protein [Acidilobus saccharovorans]ADL19174.1 hypothetical protein ASAC_0768 [Acidilobus saccharovorans 345-15]
MSLEEILYLSLAVGFIVGLALEGKGSGHLKVLDTTSTIFILALVFSMGLVVGSEVLSIGRSAVSITAASLLIAVLPGILGAYIAEWGLRRLEGRAKGSG